MSGKYKDIQWLRDFWFHRRHKYFFSPKPINNVIPPEQFVWHKPNGIWYSWGAAWLKYLWYFGTKGCTTQKGRQWNIKKLKQIQYIYKITPNYSNILRIRKTSEIERFTRRYFSNKYDPPKNIDWGQVSKKYAGIDIPFYEPWEKLNAWYSAWDLNQGCIWHPDGMKDMELVGVKYASSFS